MIVYVALEDEGSITSRHLNKEDYELLLNHYYRLRNWDDRGIRIDTSMVKLGLEEETNKLDQLC